MKYERQFFNVKMVTSSPLRRRHNTAKNVSKYCKGEINVSKYCRNECK